MRMSRIWIAGVMAVGLVATVLAAALFWLMLTRPVAAASFVGGGL
jgi:hypothetical protein